MQFFGRTVSDTGCELLVKAGSRSPALVQQGDMTSWLDGQIVSVRPLGYHTGKYIGYCRTLIQLPGIDYTNIGGRTEVNWKTAPKKNNPSIYDRLVHTVDVDGKYQWDLSNPGNFQSKRKTRDWLVDFQLLLNLGIINQGEYDSVYNFDQKTILVINDNLINFLKHEDQYTRLNDETLRKHASITNGTYSIGAELDYDDITDFESAIGAQMDGDLTGEHADEETVIATAVTFDTDTNSYLLKLTASSGAEHNGASYGNGARINYGTVDDIRLDGANLADVEISKLAFDVGGSGNACIRVITTDITGNNLFNRLLIKGDNSSERGFYLQDGSGWGTVIIQNCIIYNFTNGDGIVYAWSNANANYNFYNNTIVKCLNGIRELISTYGTVNIKNNLFQGNTTSSFNGTNWGTTAKNISEDANSPDAAYRSKDLHTNSVFVNYASDNYKIDKDGDSTNLAIVDDGEDLSGTFTDDINHDSGWRP